MIAVLMMSATLPGIAQSDVGEMQEVQVRATSLESDLSSELAQYGHRVEVITGEEIQKNNIQDVSQALEMLAPGVHVSPKNGRGDYVNVSIQGAKGKNILWMLDGIRFNNRLFASTTILDSISPHMIERIEVLKGGQGVFYGTQGIGGVINIITKSNDGENGGEFSVGGGTLNDRNIAGYTTTEYAGNDILIFGNHDRADGYLPFRDAAYETTATKTDRGFDRTNIGFKIDRDMGTNKNVNFFVQRNDVDADFARPYNQFQNASNDRDEHLVSLKFNHAISEDLSYFVKGYYHDWWTDFTRVGINDTGTLTNINNDDEWGFEDYGANAMLQYDLGKHSEWIVGADAQRYWGRDQVLGFRSDRETVLAGYSQYRTQLGTTKLALSGRYNSPDFAEDKFIGEGSLKHPLTQGLSVRFKAGNSFRLPDSFELFSTSFGNENLDPENAVGYEAGLEGQQSLAGMPISFRADYFHRTIEDRIGISGGQYVNTDAEVTSRGVDVSFNLRFNPRWNTKVSGTWADATPDDSDRQITEVPESFSKVKLRYRNRNAGYRVAALGKYVGNVYNEPVSAREEYGNYTVLDLTGSYDLDPEGTHRVSARLENVLDEEYATSLASGTRVGGSDYSYANLGVPRNLMIEYTRTF
jgi:outer membrane cobalamin receptor